MKPAEPPATNRCASFGLASPVRGGSFSFNVSNVPKYTPAAGMLRSSVALKPCSGPPNTPLAATLWRRQSSMLAYLGVMPGVWMCVKKASGEGSGTSRVGTHYPGLDELLLQLRLVKVDRALRQAGHTPRRAARQGVAQQVLGPRLEQLLRPCHGEEQRRSGSQDRSRVRAWRRETSSARPHGAQGGRSQVVCRASEPESLAVTPCSACLKNIWPARGAVTPLYSPPRPSEATVFWRCERGGG